EIDRVSRRRLAGDTEIVKLSLMIELRIELEQAVDGGAPVGEGGVAADEPGERTVDLAEGSRSLHEPAELYGAGEVARRSNQQREEGCELTDEIVVGAVDRAAHDEAHEIVEESGEPCQRDAALLCFAAIEGDAFRFLAQSHQSEAEIGFDSLLAIAE